MSNAILDAAYHLVHQYPGGADSLAPRMDKKSATTLSHEVKATGTAKFGLQTAVEVTDLTGDLRILRWWAMHAGQLLVPLPSLEEQRADDCMQRLAMSAKEFGDFMSEVSGTLQDGKVSDNELSRIEREVGEMFASVHSTLQALRNRNQQGKPTQVPGG